MRSLEEIDKIPVHFILCTERTGSTLLSLMLNANSNVLSPSEEPFAIFFSKKYRNKTSWTEKELNIYVTEFFLMAEKSLELYFTTPGKLLESLLPYREKLTYERLIKLTYLQFLEPKPKAEIKIIVDKQIKYFFYLPLLCELFPAAKFIVLVRDVRDNAVSKSNRGLNSSSNAMFLSALWHYTYSNIEFLKKNNRDFIVVKYENMVTESEPVIRRICEFLGIEFSRQMIETEGYYEMFLSARKQFVAPEFLNRLTDFHSGLFSKPNARKIGIYKTLLDPGTEAKVLKLNKELYNFFNYDYLAAAEVRYDFNDRLQILLAYLYRPLLLSVYFRIPFSLKKLIKKVRRKNVRV